MHNGRPDRNASLIIVSAAVHYTACIRTITIDATLSLYQTASHRCLNARPPRQGPDEIPPFYLLSSFTSQITASPLHTVAHHHTNLLRQYALPTSWGSLCKSDHVIQVIPAWQRLRDFSSAKLCLRARQHKIVFHLITLQKNRDGLRSHASNEPEHPAFWSWVVATSSSSDGEATQWLTPQPQPAPAPLQPTIPPTPQPTVASVAVPTSTATYQLA
jgi:hypothetical protein